jgi:hypothetical protein
LCGRGFFLVIFDSKKIEEIFSCPFMPGFLPEKYHNNCDAKDHKEAEDNSQNIPPVKVLLFRLKSPWSDFMVIFFLNFAPLLIVMG